MLGRLWFNEVVGQATLPLGGPIRTQNVIRGMIDRQLHQAAQEGNMVWYRTLLALTTSILAGTGYEQEGGQRPLQWMAAFKFESLHDGARTGYTPLRFASWTGASI